MSQRVGDEEKESVGSDDSESLGDRVDMILIRFFDIIAWIYNLFKAIPGGKAVVEKCVDSPKFREMFDEFDVKGNGVLEPDEVYTLVLRFYLFVAQYTQVVVRHVPTRQDVESVILRCDTNGDGVIGFSEFRKIILLLCEGVTTQLSAQLFFTAVISPQLAVVLMWVLGKVATMFPSVWDQLWFIPPPFRSYGMGTACLMLLINFIVIPYYLEYIFYIQSLRNPDKVRFVPDMSQFQPLPMGSLSTNYDNTSDGGGNLSDANEYEHNDDDEHVFEQKDKQSKKDD